MASFSAMYQKLREFLQEKDLAKTSGYQNQYAWEPFSPLLYFPTLGTTGRARTVLIYYHLEIIIHLEKVKLSALHE